jgi:tetratricopeptide (TPR) repeat protein
MAASTIPCPACGAILEVNPAQTGSRQLHCRKCGVQLRVTPRTSKPAAPAAITAASRPPASGYAVPPPLQERPPAAKAFMSRGLGIALICSVLVIGGGIIAAIILTQGNTPSGRDSENLTQGNTPSERDSEKRIEVPKKDKSSPPRDDSTRKKEANEEEQQKRRRLQRFLVQAGIDLAGKRYAEALKGYQQALDLFPNDPDALQGLSEAKAGLLVVESNKENQTKRKEEFAQLMELGRTAMKNKQYAAAIGLFESALKLEPTDVDARENRQEAQEALDSDKAEKQKLEQFQKLMKAARAAMDANRYDEAIRKFQEATELVPEDREAAQGLQLARQADAYSRAMVQGTTARRENRVAEAIKAFEEALKIIPKDKAAAAALKEAKQALTAAKSEFARLMQSGATALENQRYEEAVQIYNEAVRLNPDNEEAAAALARAKKLVETLAANQAAYQRFMATGVAAMRNKAFAAALKNFNEALRLMPNDADALQGARDAQAALTGMAQAKADFDKQMQTADAAYRRGQYAAAVKAYEEALELVPGDKRALAGRRQARYRQNIAEGQDAMNAKRYGDAIQKFRAALEEKPGDSLARLLLQRAQAQDRTKKP